jgi:hypothetical protein
MEKGRVAGCGLLADIRQAPPTSFASKLFDSSRVSGAGAIVGPSCIGDVSHN